jgi:hypothetical protein
MLKGSIQTHSQTRSNWTQRVIACLLLVMVVAFLVVNPLWECHDHLDNLRHLGPNGVLLIILLFACAGITLFKSFCWFSLTGLRTLQLSPQLFRTHRLYARAMLPSVSPVDLLLPLRI